MSRRRAEPPRLARRVALVGAAWAAVAGACGALIAAMLSGGLLARYEDRVALAAVAELADEIDEELTRGAPDDPADDRHPIRIGPDGAPVLATVLDHELADVREPGAVAAIVDATGVVAGDPRLPTIASGDCEVLADPELERRVCAAALGDGRLVVLGVSAQDERERRRLTWWSLLVGALVGAALGGLASHRSASWTIAPLTELGDRVRRIDADAPRADLLEPPARHAELEALRDSVAQLVARLGHALVHAQSFAAQAAHELRTPLAVLAGELELMLEGEPADPATVRRLQARVHELVRLVQRLLVLARPGRAPAEQGEAVELAEVIDGVIGELGVEQRARVHVELAREAIIRGDAELLRAMIHNAVDNALKFSDARVDVRVTATRESVDVDVIDAGPGIPPHEREAVFAAFHRGAASPGVAGHGIGLALIAHVAAAHAGAVRLLEVDRGAHLRISLPRWCDDGR
ncbi:MAG: HAMP domain-containing histidine kinase [Deltaproteobacteria bacterium]|nr:HAMP domain-containing histidine kinase [Deltaproteobacteria bacterium]